MSSEFDLLKASHKFLRSDDNSSTKLWNEQLAEKYYANLYKEFAVCDLKHYKSGNFALRWRTEDEVISGAGETTCANTRCEHHHPTQSDRSKVPLTTLELPFAYVEHGEEKSALVKVVLCDRCVRKLMWKRNKDKERAVKQEKESLSAEGSSHDRKRKGKSKAERDHRKRPRHEEHSPRSRALE